MALKDVVNFAKSTWDDLKTLWVNGSQKISSMAFDEDVFYDIAGNVSGKKGGQNGFVMLNEARDTMRDELDTLSLRLYNNKYNVSSQAELEKAYSNLYNDETRKRLFQQQIVAAERGKGLFGEKYSNFDFSDGGKHLTEEQKGVLFTHFNEDYKSRLEDIYRAYVPDNMVLSQSANLNAKGQSLNGQAWVERFEGEVVDGSDIVDIVENADGTVASNAPISGTGATDVTEIVPYGAEIVPTGTGTQVVPVGTAVDTPLNRVQGTPLLEGPNSPSVVSNGTPNGTPLLEGPSSSTTVEQAVELNERARHLNFNYGMQKKYIGENTSVLDFATSADSVDMRGINNAINNSSHAEELNAYRSYLNERLMTVPDKTGTWEAPDSIYDYFTKKGYDAETARQLNSEYNRLVSKRLASGNPDHSGIGIWQMAKRHPVIATGVVMGTAFGISELVDESE